MIIFCTLFFGVPAILLFFCVKYAPSVDEWEVETYDDFKRELEAFVGGQAFFLENRCRRLMEVVGFEIPEEEKPKTLTVRYAWVAAPYDQLNMYRKLPQQAHGGKMTISTQCSWVHKRRGRLSLTMMGEGTCFIFRKAGHPENEKDVLEP